MYRKKVTIRLLLTIRLDDMLFYMLEHGGDANQVDNMGLSPLQMITAVPLLSVKVKEYLISEKAKKKKEVAEKGEIPLDNLELFKVEICVKGGKAQSLLISENHTYEKHSLLTLFRTEQVIEMAALAFKVAPHTQYLELSEDVMGKERLLTSGESVLKTQDKWPNKNPKFCRFLLKLKRGTPGDAQMAFRDVIYGK
jgi:hypothetical protein